MRAAWWALAWYERKGHGLGRFLVPALLVGLVIAGQLVAPWTAIAEDKREFKYPYTWVYKAAYRLLKIDLKCPIEEADPENGFIMFEYEYEGAKTPASVEIVDLSSDDAGYSVNVRVKMEKLPSWVEVDLMDQVEAKLKGEFGDPPSYKKKQEPKPKQEPAPEGDGEGKGGGEGKDGGK